MNAAKPWLMPAIYILAGAVITALLFTVSQPARGYPIGLTPAPTLMVRVQVDGRVTQPGLYSLAEGARVEDAITAAGGTQTGTDLSTLNLARPLKDGEKITVGVSTSVQSSAAEPAAALIDLNTATAAQLDSLPGIGAARAEAILTYRTDHGSYVSVDELLQVPGISQDLYAKIKDLVKVQ